MNADERRYGEDNSGLNDVTFQVNGCAMTVLNAIGHGFHEKIYENAMALELAHAGLKLSCQKPFDIWYRNENIGTFIPDLVVEDRVIVELRTIDRIGAAEKGQVLNYLRAAGLHLGIILNFRNPKLEWQRVVLG